MYWRSAGSKDLKVLWNFIAPQESRAINLSTLFWSTPGELRWPPSSLAQIWILEEESEILGILALRRKTALIPCFSPVYFSGKKWEAPQLPFRIRKNQHFSLIGPTQWTRIISNQLPVAPYRDVNYRFMEWAASPPDGAQGLKFLPSLWDIRTAREKDLEILFPLQKAYELEEVCASPDEFQEWISRHNFEQALKLQKVWYLTDQDGTPVAKGGTNALGRQWAQLGGIFTIPSLRGRGLGKILVKRIQEELVQAGYRPCLFVKKENIPAIKLYSGLGFRTMEDFSISYFLV